MKKGELLKLKPLKLGKKMIRVAESDIGEKRTQYQSRYSSVRRGSREVWTYKYYDYIAAEVENEILKVGLWKRTAVLTRQEQPDFTIFLEKTECEWLTYNHCEKKWLTGMIFNIPVLVHMGEQFGVRRYATPETEKVVCEYLGIKDNVFEAIRKFQVNQKKELRSKRNKSELARIDAFMENVPEYPAGYNNDWLRKAIFENNAPIVYKPGKKTVEGICLRCKKPVEIKMKPVHGQAVKCPSCKSAARLHSWGKQQQISERMNVGILLPTKSEEYCLCVQDVLISFKREEDYETMHIWKAADFRFRLNGWFTPQEAFEWYEYQNTGIIRWCKAKQHGMGWSAYSATDYCKLYTGNLHQTLKNSQIKYVPVKEILQYDDKQHHMADVLESIRSRRDMVEKLAKVGLLGMVWEDVVRTYGSEELNRHGSSLEEIMKVDKERVKTAIRIKANMQELKVLQAAYRAKVFLADDLIKGIAEFYGNQAVNDLYFIVQRHNLTKQIGYMRKLPTYKPGAAYGTARDYEDFLRQLETLEIPRTKENKFPANFYRVHAELQAQIDEMKANLEKAELAKKNKVLKKLVKGLKTKYGLESEQFVIVWPQTKQDFSKEGQLQHNCVGGYFDRMCNKETVVFFLRKKEDPETPYCTVEFQRNKCIQCRMIYNREADKEAWEYMHNLEQYLVEQEEKKEDIA